MTFKENYFRIEYLGIITMLLVSGLLLFGYIFSTKRSIITLISIVAVIGIAIYLHFETQAYLRNKAIINFHIEQIDRLIMAKKNKTQILGYIEGQCGRHGCNRIDKCVQVQRPSGEIILACQRCKGYYIKKRK